MILILEIAMLIFGIIALVKGKFTLTKKKIVTGAAARIVGVILLMPLPLSFGVGVIMGIMLAAQGRQIQAKEIQNTGTIIEVVSVLGCCILAIGVSLATSHPPAKKRIEPIAELEADE